ncbi:MAG: hypothetical protein ACYTGC_11835, partial [Planctomycetota bacterium]
MTPGCDNAKCCSAVCELDSYCCDVGWDQLCVDAALEICAGCGDPASGSCFVDNGTVGCDNAECCALVCSLDPFCCETTWDGLCVGMALESCAPNDDCANRLEAFNGETVFSNEGASTDGPSPCSLLGSDVWFRYVAPFTGSVTVSTCGSDFDTVLAVYDGCTCLPDLEDLLECNDDSCDLQSEVTIDVVAGQCYKIQIGGFNGAQGQGLLTITKLLEGCGDLNSGSCFAANGTPFCDDADCCDTVCMTDPFCCDVVWDSLCVSEALVVCAGCGSPGAGDCFADNGSPGCNDESCCLEICSFDPFCCETTWDGICAGEALAACGQPPLNDDCLDRQEVFNGLTSFNNLGATTDGPLLPDDCPSLGSDVWFNYTADFSGFLRITVGDLTFNAGFAVYDGCECPPDAATLIACAPEFLPPAGGGPLPISVTIPVAFEGCYKIQIGGTFVDQGVGSLLLTKEPGCGNQAAGDCLTPNPTPFCNDANCCEVVCSFDPFCCDVEWDDLCVSDALIVCASCPGEGSCFEANGTPGCDDANCCKMVCAVDTFCCTDEWDLFCAWEAGALCRGCGLNPAGDCLTDTGTPACANINCCNQVCNLDAYCCDVGWDQLCADQAAEICCLPDIILDGVVGVDDLLELILEWGPCPAFLDICPADIDGNRQVDVDDLLDLILAWGPCAF